MELGVDSQYVKELNKKITELSKLNDQLRFHTITQTEYINQVEFKIVELKNITANRKTAVASLKKYNPADYPENFEFWFNKYYEDIISLQGLTNIYKLNRITIKSKISSYIRVKSMAPKNRYLNTEYGIHNKITARNIPEYNPETGEVINKYSNYNFDFKSVYKSGIAKTQYQLYFLIWNYYLSMDTDNPKRDIIISFGKDEDPAIIDTSIFRFPLKTFGLTFILNQTTVLLFNYDDPDYIFHFSAKSPVEKEGERIYPGAKIFTFIDAEKDDKHSKLIQCNPNINTLQISPVEINENELYNKVFWHKINDNESLITLEELEQEIYELEGISINIPYGEEGKSKDQIYVPHYPYTKPLPKGCDLDLLFDRLKQMGLDL